MSTQYEPLEKYYPGDDKWRVFVSCFENEWKKCTFQQKLTTQLSMNSDIAKVVYATVGDIALDWIKTAIPALENLSPQKCLETRSGTLRLKVMLMRMPR